MEKVNKKNIIRTLRKLFLIILLAMGAYFLIAKFTNIIDKTNMKMSKNYPDKVLNLLDLGLYADGNTYQNIKDEYKEKLIACKTYGDADNIIKEIIKVSGGKHSFIKTKEELKNTKIQNKMPDIKLENEILNIKMYGIMADDKTNKGYASIINEALLKKNYKAIIIDVSSNRGGDMGPMLQGLNSLIPEGKIVTFKTTLGDKTVQKINGEIKGGGSLVKIENNNDFIDKKIAIITSENTGSSGEQVVLALKGLKNVRLFGTKTAGYTSINSTFKLDSGNSLFYTIGYTVGRDGIEYKETPVIPDVEVPLDKAVVEATKWIN